VIDHRHLVADEVGRERDGEQDDDRGRLEAVVRCAQVDDAGPARRAGSSAASAPSSASVGGSWPAARRRSSSASGAAESPGAGAGRGGGDAAGSSRRGAGAPGTGAPRAAARGGIGTVRTDDRGFGVVIRPREYE
jgi:hypothetical protein